MSDDQIIGNDFLAKATRIIEENIPNEQFGVSELASEMGMSRSNLLRKIKKLTGLSVSQFIRQIRLKHGMDFLSEKSLTVSEVAYKVGFSSPSYFIKCFKDHYGYPPGDVGKIELDESINVSPDSIPKKRIKPYLVIIGVVIVLIILSFFIYRRYSTGKVPLEKSIAVLPFINDSNDSTNIHIINGLMESILNNLQKIEDLRVISRTSVEKYRDNPEIISRIAEELNVNYFVEGSGQKIGDQIQLSVQLIEAPSDKHLWAEQYNRSSKDIFQLQKDVAKKIASQIQAIITPEEEKRIEKTPTDNVDAYEYFLKGREMMNLGTGEGLEEAIILFDKAIELDGEFARAHAAIAIAYYYLDIFQIEKKNSELINTYADKALLLDAQLSQSLIAKSLYYMNTGSNEEAVPYLEKALVYNPNSAMVLNMLSDFYATRMPDSEKYLFYALKGEQLDISAHDSTTASFIYLHISNALIQSGFTEEAETFINKSLSYSPENLYSVYVKAYIQYAGEKNLSDLNMRLLQALDQDTTRLDIMQEVAKSYYFLGDYESAWNYYNRFNSVKEVQKLDIYPGENGKIAVVMEKMGLTADSEEFLNKYRDYANQDNSIYKDLSLSAFYSYQGDKEKALEHLRSFSHQENYQYWVILFLELEPLMENVKNLPEFKKILKDMESKFWKKHNKIKTTLQNEGLM